MFTFNAKELRTLSIALSDSADMNSDNQEHLKAIDKLFAKIASMASHADES